jgi:activator of HSP90 ATPase
MKDYKLYTKIKASPEDIYNCITNPLTIELWSGYPAKMEEQEGTEFELWEGDISGKVLQLEPFTKIVQQWYFGEQEEPSIVTYILHKEKNHVSVELRHTNIPDEVYEEFVEGWDINFFGAIKAYLEED